MDLRQSAIDVALRFGWVRDGDFVAKKLLQFREVICGSPKYLSSSEAIRKPGDLPNHHWIGFTGFGGVQQTAEMKDRAGNQSRVAVSCRVRTSNAPSQKFCALAGAGLTRLPSFVVQDELEDGRLIAVLDAFELDGPSLYAVRLVNRYKSSVVKALLGFLESDFVGKFDTPRAL